MNNYYSVTLLINPNTHNVASVFTYINGESRINYISFENGVKLFNRAKQSNTSWEKCSASIRGFYSLEVYDDIPERKA